MGSGHIINLTQNIEYSPIWRDRWAREAKVGDLLVSGRCYYLVVALYKVGVQYTKWLQDLDIYEAIELLESRRSIQDAK